MSDFEFEDPSMNGPKVENKARREEPREEQRRDESRRDNKPRSVGLNLAAGFEQQRRTSIGGLSDMAMSTITKIFEEAKDYENPNLNDAIKRSAFRMMPLNSIGSANNPALIMTLTRKDLTLAYVFIFEQPDAQQQTRPLVQRDEQFDCIVTPEDQVTNAFARRISTHLGIDERSLFVVNWQVILSEVTAVLAKGGEITPQVTKVVADVVNNAIDALSYAYEDATAKANGTIISDVSLNPTSIGPNDQMEVLFDFPSTVAYDSSGVPFAPDVTANVYYSSRIRNEYDDRDDQEIIRERLGNVSATLDLYLDDEDVDAPVRGFNRRRQTTEDQPFWQAVLDIRGIGGARGLPFSREQALYQIAQIAHLTNDYRWVHALKPKSAVTQVGGTVVESLVDLGVLSMYNPVEDKRYYMEGASSHSNTDKLIDYLAEHVKKEVAVAISLPKSAEKSWATAIFTEIAEAENANEVAKLTTSLYDTCDVLTGGLWSDIIKGSELENTAVAPVHFTGKKDLIGVWQDKNGLIRPLTEWSVAAVATHFKDRKDHEDIVREYQLTFEADPSRSPEYWLSLRYDILRKYVLDNLRVTGTADKLAFNPVFLRLLGEAISKTSLDPRIGNVDGVQKARRAGNSGWSQYGTSDVGVTNYRRRDDSDRRHRRSVYSGRRFI